MEAYGSISVYTDAWRMHMNAYGCMRMHLGAYLRQSTGYEVHTYILYMPYDRCTLLATVRQRLQGQSRVRIYKVQQSSRSHHLWAIDYNLYMYMYIYIYHIYIHALCIRECVISEVGE